MPLVTVVVRTLERPHFLARALKDIAAQTLADLEVVVVNDGGEPGPVDDAVAAAPAALHGAVRVIHHETRYGMETGSNEAIRATQSTFVAIHDDDDLWEPAFLDRTTAVLTETGEHLAAVRTDIRFEHLAGEEWETYDTMPFHGDLREITLQDVVRTNRVVPIGLLVRRTLFDEVGLYDETLPAVGDWEFLLRAMSRHRVVLVDELLAHWMQRPGAAGADGNSVLAKLAEHERHDALVRARAIREDLTAHGGLGRYLFHAHLSGLDDMRHDDTVARLERLETRLDGIERRLEDLFVRLDERTSLGHRARSILHRGDHGDQGDRGGQGARDGSGDDA